MFRIQKSHAHFERDFCYSSDDACGDGTRSVPNMVIPIPITNRVVKVMGSVFNNCPLDERNITFCLSSGFLKHLFDITFARNSSISIPRSDCTAK